MTQEINAIITGNLPAALQSYKQALKLNESNVPALYGITLMKIGSILFIRIIGIIKCQILEDNFDEAEQQLEFLNEIQAATGM